MSESFTFDDLERSISKSIDADLLGEVLYINDYRKKRPINYVDFKAFGWKYFEYLKYNGRPHGHWSIVHDQSQYEIEGIIPDVKTFETIILPVIFLRAPFENLHPFIRRFEIPPIFKYAAIHYTEMNIEPIKQLTARVDELHSKSKSHDDILQEIIETTKHLAETIKTQSQKIAQLSSSSARGPP